MKDLTFAIALVLGIVFVIVALVFAIMGSVDKAMHWIIFAVACGLYVSNSVPANVSK